MPEPLEWDKGLDAAKFKRVLELAGWLQGKLDGAVFERSDVESLQSWSHFRHQADHGFTMEFAAARQLLKPFGLRIDTVGSTYRKRRAIKLTPQERQALLLALSVADPGDPRGDDGVPFGVGVDRREAEALLDFGDELDVVLEALRRRCPVEITHRGRRRAVDPYGLGFRNGRWYLVGRDHERDRLRVFGLGRGGPGAPEPSLIGERRSFERPDDLDVAAVLEVSADPSRRRSAEPVLARIRVDGDAIGLAERLFGRLQDAEARRERLGGREPTMHLRTRDVVVDHLGIDELVSAMLALRSHAVLVSPPEAVDRLCEHLQRIVGPAGSEPVRTDDEAPPRVIPSTVAEQVKAGGRLTAERRLKIVATAMALAEAEDSDVSLEHIGRLTGAKPEQVRAALEQFEYAFVTMGDEEMLVDNGLHVDEDGRVSVTEPWLLTEWQPTLPQALRLYVAATTALALEVHDEGVGSPPSASNHRLEAARTKLAHYLGHALGLQGSDTSRALRRLVEVAAPGLPDAALELRSIMSAGRTAWVTYQAPLRSLGDVEAELDPLHLRLVGDRWVFEGRVRRQRTIRPGHGGEQGLFETPDEAVIVAIPITDVHSVRLGDRPAEQVQEGFDVTPAHAPLVVKLEVTRAKQWLLDPYPLLKRPTVKGERVRATVELPNEVELRTLMLRIGADGGLYKPSSLRGMAAAIAREMLTRHGR